MKEIIFATGNAGKMREIREIMADLKVPVHSMKEAGIDVDIVEDGTTFEENAMIKARAVAKESEGAVVMADDSGLEVDYLNKEPASIPHLISGRILLMRSRTRRSSTGWQECRRRREPHGSSVRSLQYFRMAGSL